MTLKLLGPDVAIGFSSCLCVVFLMVLFADPEGRGGQEEGIHLIAFATQEGDHAKGRALLLLILIEDATAVLRPYIIAHSVCLRRIMYLEENLAERLVTHLPIVIFDKDSLHMVGLVVTHIGVGGETLLPTGVAHQGLLHSRNLFQLMLYAPETASGENSRGVT